MAATASQAHLKDVRDAPARGQIPLVGDLLRDGVDKLRGIGHHVYPETGTGGVSWSVSALEDEGAD